MNSNICQYSLKLAYFCFFNNRRKFVILLKIGFDWFDCLSREMSAAYFTGDWYFAAFNIQTPLANKNSSGTMFRSIASQCSKKEVTH